MRATWYVLEDGTAVDPSECTADEMGNVLTHKSGKVAMRAPGVPMSRGVDLEESGKLMFAGKGDHDGDGSVGGAAAKTPPRPASADTQMRPTPAPKRAARQGYKTRTAKAK
jgi:hypothetical protein